MKSWPLAFALSGLFWLTLAAFTSDGIQEPPLRYMAVKGTVRVAFYTPGEVRKLCDRLPAPQGQRVVACYWAAANTIIMPNPWQCGSDQRCAALWRHETAHALKGWAHEAD